MPRKRATRAQATHAMPKLKAFNDDDSVNEMSEAEKRAKLENLITDFKYNFENIRKQYQEVLKAGEDEIDRNFHHMRCKLSPMELKMTVKEYIEQTLSQSEERENIGSLPAKRTMPSSLSNVAQTLNKYRSRQIIETIPEEGGSSGTETGTVKRTTRKKHTTKANTVSFNPEPLSSVPNNFITPAMQRNMPLMGWGATPLVTPKFDPRLPATPANARRCRPGEVAMSLAGSPLTMQSEKSNKLVLNGEDLQLILNGQEMLEIPDDTDVKSLLSTLQNIMEKNKEKS